MSEHMQVKDCILLIWFKHHLSISSWKKKKKLKTASLSEKGAVIVPTESCSCRSRISTFLSPSVQFQSSHLSSKKLWYFWSLNQRHVQRFVYMCLFWWEYLYRDISESFLLGVRRCGCFHYKWIISENLTKGTWDQIYPLLLWTVQSGGSAEEKTWISLKLE